MIIVGAAHQRGADFCQPPPARIERAQGGTRGAPKPLPSCSSPHHGGRPALRFVRSGFVLFVGVNRGALIRLHYSKIATDRLSAGSD